MCMFYAHEIDLQGILKEGGPLFLNCLFFLSKMGGFEIDPL